MKFSVIKLTIIALQTSVNYDARGGAFSPYFNHFSNLMIVTGGIVGLIAAIKIYNNWQTGRGNTFYKVSNLFLGSLALLVVGGIIKVIFQL